MNLMKNVRTGNTARYDKALIATGRWVVDDTPAPKAKKPTDDEIATQDEITIEVTREVPRAVNSGQFRKAAPVEQTDATDTE